MKLYRVCTQNLNYPNILDYLDKHFPDGYTIINANGAWQGVREKSLVIEVVGNIDTHNDAVEKFGYWLKKYNSQQAVLVQVINVDNWLI